MAMIAITTRSSIRVKPVKRGQEMRQPNEFTFAESNLAELAFKTLIDDCYTAIKPQEREITTGEFHHGPRTLHLGDSLKLFSIRLRCRIHCEIRS